MIQTGITAGMMEEPQYELVLVSLSWHGVLEVPLNLAVTLLV